jgi:ABC-type multidrug transport system fused ATPase/permease subunit
VSQKTESTLVLLQGIWGYLSQRRRVQMGLLLVMMFASGAAELVSLGAVLPFLAVLNDPERLWQQPIVQGLAKSAGLTAAGQLILPAMAIFVTAAVLAAVVRLMNLWLNTGLAAAVGSDLSCEAYRRTLYQPYWIHLQRNSSSVITATITQINLAVAALNALLQLLTAAVVASGLMIGLLLIDWPIALAVSILFGSAYGWLAGSTRWKLRSNGERISVATNQQLKALQEGLGAIRDVLLDSSQATYLEIYRRADRPQRQLQAQNQYLSVYPRYVLEALGIAALAMLGGLLVLQRGNGTLVIPLLGAFALGAQRLLPALQQVYNGWASLKSYNAALSDVLAMLQQPLPAGLQLAEPMPLRKCVRLETVGFRYAQDLPEVLSQLTLEIRPGERIGVIGSTGSGKSTLVDLMMGLLEPTSGKILVDDKDIYDRNHPEHLNAWRASIAHVPQAIYLADSSIAENIAFGVHPQGIDMERVRRAARQAQIASFIEASDQGYKSLVGERGIRLSGGQRQRIGIARALYKQANVLVFDEATSALDNGTERAVMQAIEGLSRNLTLVMIAHRLSTLSNCDRVIELRGGFIHREMKGVELFSQKS